MAELILSQDLTEARLKELLEYFPETGIFRWRVSSARRSKVGDVAGSPDSGGYLRITIDSKKYAAHRLAWLYIHGVWPSDQIDHINRDRSDNRVENLREASGSENNRNKTKYENNTSGHPGVCWNKQTQKWQAHIRHLGERIHLGLFTEKADAIAARAAAEIKYWGGTANSINP